METKTIKDWGTKGFDLPFKVNAEGFVIEINGQHYDAIYRLLPEKLEDIHYCFNQLGLDGAGRFMEIDEYED